MSKIETASPGSQSKIKIISINSYEFRSNGSKVIVGFVSSIKK
jgi:hypothetical protein